MPNIPLLAEQLANYFLTSNDALAVAFRTHLTQTHQTTLEDWLDDPIVEDMLGISHRTLQRLRANKILPFARIEGKCYYRRSDIEALLEQRINANK